MAETPAIRRAISAGTENQQSDPIAQLVRRATDGSPDAWGALVDRFSGALWAIAAGHRLNAADAADVFQTTWLRLVEHLDDLNDLERVGAWLATTARRECLRVLRLAQRQILVGDDLPEPATDASEPIADLMRAERDAMLREAISRLRAADQALLCMLTAAPALSYREIAASLEMPIGSIGPTRARCLERLRRELELVELSHARRCPRAPLAAPARAAEGITSDRGRAAARPPR
jgi:RNA polymerase sigma factor (sigma-70 family)